jgi:hypothetical protein
MERSVRMAFMVAIVGVSLAMSAGRAERADETPQPQPADALQLKRVAPGDVLTLRDFEQTGFVARYRLLDRRRNGQGAQQVNGYLFEDPENPRARVMVELGPDPQNVQFVTVVWHGEALIKPASWTGMKSRFIADLVQATFPEIEYGELSSYVWEQQGQSYPEGVGAIPKARMPGARVFAGATGSSLVVGFERFPRAQP